MVEGATIDSMMIKKESEMVADFAMFSEAGNIAVAGIVAYHKQHGSPWSLVLQNLQDLANYDYDKYGEAMDTAVRELVYEACGCTGDFYI